MTSAANLMETRLITINSSHRSSPNDLTTNFSVDLNNATPEIRDRCVGVSVETVGFLNVMNNITPLYSRMLVTHFDGVATTTEHVVTLTVGHYDYTEFALEVQTAVTVALSLAGGEFTTTAVPESGGDPAMISLAYTIGGYINITYDRLSATYPLGIGESIQLTSAGGAQSFRPNLQGPMAVKLVTRALCSSRASVDGDGTPAAVIMTIPIQTAFGQIENMHMGGEERPLVTYGHGSSRDLTNIDVSLRHLDGSIVDLGTGEMYVTFRVWLDHV